MISIKVLLFILFLHFVGDFVLQSRNMAINKSKSNLWLSLHVVTYSIPLVLVGPPFAAVNGIGHWLTDYVSSRMTSYCHRNQKWWLFYFIVGVDQLLHYILLFTSYMYLKDKGIMYV